MATKIAVLETTPVFPQQFNVYKGGKQIGYMRMEYSKFQAYVHYPYEGRDGIRLIHVSHDYKGVDCFKTEKEKMKALQEGVNHIVKRYNEALIALGEKKKVIKKKRNAEFQLVINH